MEKSSVIPHDKLIYYRLIALWVICEALLGGIIHGLKLPVSGLVVGSSAVICICLIAYHVPSKGAILKATLIVLIFKMMLSPHSPLPAYFAVLFQGFLGEVLFFKRINYKFSCVLFGLIALLESAVQRILVVTILYGKDIWEAINDFINGFAKTSTDYSYWLIVFYLAAHIMVGIIVGWFAAGLPKRMNEWDKENLFINEGEIELKTSVRKNKMKPLFFVTWIILILILLQSYLQPGNPVLPSNRVIQILIRSVIILFTWYFLVSPLLTAFLKRWLAKKQEQSQHTVGEILQLLPSTKYIVVKSWQLSSAEKGLKRFRLFCKMVLTNILQHA